LVTSKLWSVRERHRGTRARPCQSPACAILTRQRRHR